MHTQYGIGTHNIEMDIAGSYERFANDQGSEYQCNNAQWPYQCILFKVGG